MNLSLSPLKDLGFGIFRVLGAMMLDVGLLILIDEYQPQVLQDKCRANVRPLTIIVARETLSARTEINSSSNRNNVQRYLEQRSTTLGKRKGKRSQRIHMANTYLILTVRRARTQENGNS